MERLADILRAASDPTRLRMIALCAEGELTVSEITSILGMTQPAVSRHLKVLSDAGLLDRFREGAWVFHRLADDGEESHVARWLAAACENEDSETRRRDRQRLDEIRAARAAEAEAYFHANAAQWDEIRSLHVDDALVEARLADLAPAAAVGDYLDVGVGAGRILELLAPRADRAIGLDVNHAMLTIARDRIAAAALANCTLRHGDIYAAPFPDDRFDLITAHLALHYFDKPGEAIREIARMLKPGGDAVIVDFAPHQLERLREEHAHRRLGFSDEEMRRWFADAGLSPTAEDRLPGDPLTVCFWRAEKRAA